MFEREHHQRIAAILERLDVQVLLKHRCLFGGGTAIALSRGEYRESVDIDFICPSVDGYRGLRETVDARHLDWLFAQPVDLVREPRVDQYGIRLAVAVDAVPVKLEIIFESRVDFTDPLPEDRICGVWAMAVEDLTATKLMANADRYADDAVMSRDLIDLSMLAHDHVLNAAGAAKARRAYGKGIDKAFARGKELLLERDGRLSRCMKAMRMPSPEEDWRERLSRLSLEA